MVILIEKMSLKALVVPIPTPEYTSVRTGPQSIKEEMELMSTVMSSRC